jgi:hypothetical protein
MLKVNHPSTEWRYTSLQGYLEADYAGLVRVLGEPVGPSPDDKCAAMWRLEFPDGLVATIYDYKVAPCYRGPAGTPVEEIRTWHIGGYKPEAVRRVGELLESPTRPRH